MVRIVSSTSVLFKTKVNACSLWFLVEISRDRFETRSKLFYEKCKRALCLAENFKGASHETSVKFSSITCIVKSEAYHFAKQTLLITKN